MQNCEISLSESRQIRGEWTLIDVWIVSDLCQTPEVQSVCASVYIFVWEPDFILLVNWRPHVVSPRTSSAGSSCSCWTGYGEKTQTLLCWTHVHKIKSYNFKLTTLKPIDTKKPYILELNWLTTSNCTTLHNITILKVLTQKHFFINLFFFQISQINW